ncbi:hypothetical protein EET67_04945 [Pseudaminobacter arsenicus]|uniref:Uncharacterized protein n=1 Tax=Borborobacter arsenicus TaxID=1851146 RepID=A0A432V9Y4_9HYPH|nr:hypothetical protein [Pseudaminobacter arsenicus]RUM98991.1 hypothetical protein EET67_04945 [Pseudaminobacter arsenicus]
MTSSVARLHVAVNNNQPRRKRWQKVDLTEEDKRRIRVRRGYGARIVDLARQFGVNVSAIRRVCDTAFGVNDTERSVVHMQPVIGAAGSATCYHQPVSLPRIALIDGPYHEGAAA